MSPGKSHKWELAGFLFPTNAAVERHIRAMFARYGHMQRLSAADEDFVRALIAHHPHKEKKIGCGIDYIFVQHLSPPSQRRYVIQHTDKSWDDFAWRNCLSPKKAKGQIDAICRTLIIAQKDDFKARTFADWPESCCANPTCNSIITRDTCHVDHTPPATFAKLVADWIATLHITEYDIGIVYSSKYGQPSVFEDDMLAPNWQEYHLINARLRCLCRNCNLSVTRKNNTSPERF